jgi:hypothetical protein
MDGQAVVQEVVEVCMVIPLRAFYLGIAMEGAGHCAFLVVDA